MKKEHKYAQLLRWIAGGEEIEIDGDFISWHKATPSDCLMGIINFAYEPKSYRVKPKTIRIGAFDVPEPMRVAPADGSPYWLAQTTGIIDFDWDEYTAAAPKEWLALGLLHATKENAEAMRNALLSLTKAPA